MWKEIKDWLLLGLTLIILILFIALLNKCGNTLNKNKANKSNDTVYIYKHKIDTIYSDPKIIHDIVVKIPKPKVDTLYKPIYIDSNDCKRIYVYQDSIIDSNLIFRYKAYTQGILRALKPNYTLKVPIKIIDSIETIKIVKIQPKFALDGSLILSKGIIAPGIEVGLKRFKMGLGYNLQTNNPVFTIKIPIYTKY